MDGRTDHVAHQKVRRKEEGEVDEEGKGEGKREVTLEKDKGGKEGGRRVLRLERNERRRGETGEGEERRGVGMEKYEKAHSSQEKAVMNKSAVYHVHMFVVRV